MAEAQACGTPVIAFNRGAAAEIILHGETGFVVDTVDQMVQAIGRIGEINPLACRLRVERHFDGPVMAGHYVRIYESILSQRPYDISPLLTGRRRGDGASSWRVA
jgi:glycosyltransferase involved in cell wall biosynthesis